MGTSSNDYLKKLLQLKLENMFCLSELILDLHLSFCNINTLLCVRANASTLIIFASSPLSGKERIPFSGNHLKRKT